MPSVVVTGASRGLGYAFVKHYAQQGHTVVGIVRNKSATEERLAKDNIANVHILAADITDSSAIQAAADATAKLTGGTLDLLINNAALAQDDESAFLEVPDMTPEQIQKHFKASFDANVIGLALTTNAFLPLVRKGSMKKVITISTGMADADLVTQYDVAGAGAYAISKAGTNMLVAKYHAALGRSEGILFLSISPGVVDTSEGKAPTPEKMEAFGKLASAFVAYAPDFKGPISAEESVKACDGIIQGATVEEMGGAFVSHLGKGQKWL